MPMGLYVGAAFLQLAWTYNSKQVNAEVKKLMNEMQLFGLTTPRDYIQPDRSSNQCVLFKFTSLESFIIAKMLCA
jgi:hypothetical protein